MGIPEIPYKQPGTIHLPAWVVNGKREIICLVEWQMTEVGKLSPSGINQIQATEPFYHVNSVMATDGDKVYPGSYVVLQHPTTSEQWIGRAIEILSHCNSPHTASHIVVSLLEILPNLHSCLQVLCLRETLPEQRVIVTPDVG